MLPGLLTFSNLLEEMRILPGLLLEQLHSTNAWPQSGLSEQALDPPLPWPGALHTAGETMGVGMVMVSGGRGHNLSCVELMTKEKSIIFASN